MTVDRPRWKIESGLPGCAEATVAVEGVLGGVVYARVSGSLHARAAGAATQEIIELLRLPIRALRLDLSGVTFIDSSGLGVLILARGHAELHGVPFTLEGVPGHVERAFDAAGLAATFDRAEP
jgi:anti-sigma B factor antagonist